jgi:hypothetical protein
LPSGNFLVAIQIGYFSSMLKLLKFYRREHTLILHIHPDIQISDLYENILRRLEDNIKMALQEGMEV